jgi:predicted CopG family antitoxin
MTDETIDIEKSVSDELKDYLKKQKQQPLQEAIKRLSQEYIEHDIKDQKRHTEVIGKFEAYDYRIAQIERTLGMKVSNELTLHEKLTKGKLRQYLILLVFGFSIGLSFYIGAHQGHAITVQSTH